MTPSQVLVDVPLAPMTTYKMGGAAAHFAEPGDLDELRSLISRFGDGRITVLGRGSNVVISDRGVDGLVVRLSGAFGAIEVRPPVVHAGGAVSLPVLARAAAAQARGGLEWCVGVPGSVGGAVRMNAGCHGSDVARCLAEATIIDLRDGEVARRGAADLGLSYRHSDLTDDELVAFADFTTTEIDPEVAAAEIRRITQWRKENQPGGTLNAGSVFKNPPGDAAGRLIDGEGLKGLEVGAVRVSPRHANFFEASSGATAQQLYDLVWRVRRIVGEHTGVWLEPELRFIGEFEPSPDEMP